MSWVTNAILTFGLSAEATFGPNNRAHFEGIVDEINAAFAGKWGGFRHLDEVQKTLYAATKTRLLPDKCLEVNVAVAALSSASIEELVDGLKAFPWQERGIPWAQVFLCDQEDGGFGLVEIHRNEREAGRPFAWDKR